MSGLLERGDGNREATAIVFLLLFVHSTGFRLKRFFPVNATSCGEGRGWRLSFFNSRTPSPPPPPTVGDKVQVLENGVPARVPGAEVATRCMTTDESREETRQQKERGESERAVKLEKAKELKEDKKESKITMSDARVLLFDFLYNQVGSNFCKSGAAATQSVPGLSHGVSLPADPAAQRFYGEGWSADGGDKFSRKPPVSERQGRARRIYDGKSQVDESQLEWMRVRAGKVRVLEKEGDMLKSLNFDRVATEMGNALGFSNKLKASTIKDHFRKIWGARKNAADEEQMNWMRARAGEVAVSTQTAMFKAVDFDKVHAEMVIKMGKEKALKAAAIKVHFKSIWDAERKKKGAAATQGAAGVAAGEAEAGAGGKRRKLD